MKESVVKAIRGELHKLNIESERKAADLDSRTQALASQVDRLQRDMVKGFESVNANIQQLMRNLEQKHPEA